MAPARIGEIKVLLLPKMLLITSPLPPPLPAKSVAQYDTNTLTVFVGRLDGEDVVVAGARIVVVYPPVAVKTPEPVYRASANS